MHRLQYKLWYKPSTRIRRNIIRIWDYFRRSRVILIAYNRGYSEGHNEGFLAARYYLRRLIANVRRIESLEQSAIKCAARDEKQKEEKNDNLP